jgi:DUF1365 family protein
LDLDELPRVQEACPLLSSRKFAPVSFRHEDHLGGAGRSLAEAARAQVERVTGARPSGRVFLLTQLRHFGHYFSPLNLYYCFDDDRLAATVA